MLIFGFNLCCDCGEHYYCFYTVGRFDNNDLQEHLMCSRNISRTKSEPESHTGIHTGISTGGISTGVFVNTAKIYIFNSCCDSRLGHVLRII